MQRNDPKVYAFYQSVEWKKCRKTFIISKYGLCERCGNPGTYVHHKEYITSSNVNDTNITLNFDNLELLCHDCHNNEHFSNVDYAFDDNGNLIKSPKNDYSREIKRLLSLDSPQG
ncbi:MAG: HNH endonuclease [Clostridia bacterium]|nr:HNH endonuclease [Clostridia bacterium]